MSKTLQITQRHFLITLSIYSFFSWLIFQLTSGGWQFLVYQLIGGGFFIVILILATAGVSVMKKYGRYTIMIDRYLVYILLIYQSIYLIFNSGDCGDTPRGYTFIETVIQGSKQYYCFTEKSRFYSPQLTLWLMIIGRRLDCRAC